MLAGDSCEMFLVNCTGASGPMFWAELKLSLMISSALGATNGGAVLEMRETKKALSVFISPRSHQAEVKLLQRKQNSRDRFGVVVKRVLLCQRCQNKIWKTDCHRGGVRDCSDRSDPVVSLVLINKSGHVKHLISTDGLEGNTLFTTLKVGMGYKDDHVSSLCLECHTWKKCHLPAHPCLVSGKGSLSLEG